MRASVPGSGVHPYKNLLNVPSTQTFGRGLHGIAHGRALGWGSGCGPVKGIWRISLHCGN